MSTYIPLPPEEDPELQANPHYWFYKVTREALHYTAHPLHNMGHIWNRWAWEKMTQEERQTLEIEENYTVLSDDDKRKIFNYIQTVEEQTNYQLTSLDQNIDFLYTKWQKKVRFKKFIFAKDVNFSNTIFEQNTDFRSTIFIQNAKFSNTTFKQYTDFSFTTFIQNADFGDSVFTNSSNFWHATFTQNADFSSATFEQNTDFALTRFKQNANFKYIIFMKNANFWNATFIKNVDFSYATFKGNTNFSYATFTQNINFVHAIFSGNIIRFIVCGFLKPTNKEISFSFAHAVFAQEVNFSESAFQRLPDMTGTDFRSGINLDKVEFPPNIKETRHCERSEAISKTDYISIFLRLPRRAFHALLAMTAYILNLLRKLCNNTPEEKIRGGLTHKNAEITWHTFQTEMEKAGYHEKAVEYFGYELDAKRFNDKTPWFFRYFILNLYKWSSDYGQNILRPVIWWFVFIGLFMGIYCYHLEIIPKKCSDISIPLQLSLKGAFPFIGDQTTYYDRIFTDPVAPEACTQTSHFQDKEHLVVNQIFACDTVKLPKTTLSENSTKEPIPFNNTLELEYFPFFHGVHTFLSLILIFLFGLGVRHRLRLK